MNGGGLGTLNGAIGALFCWLVLLLPASVSAGGFGGPTAGGSRPEVPRWSYHGSEGPEHWGELARDYATCDTGQMQSPVDIQDPQPSRLPSLAFHYRSTSLQIENDGRTIRIVYPPGSYLLVGRKRFELREFHFHTPSEHSVNGVYADMEIHLVHQDRSGNTLVVAVPMVAGMGRNAMLQRLWEYLPRTSPDSRYYRRVGIKPTFLLPTNRSYYKYQGSDSTPPCSEGITWLVLKTPLEVAARQIEGFRSVMGENTRPLQRLNDRPIFFDARQGRGR